MVGADQRRLCFRSEIVPVTCKTTDARFVVGTKSFGKGRMRNDHAVRGSAMYGLTRRGTTRRPALYQRSGVP